TRAWTSWPAPRATTWARCCGAGNIKDQELPVCLRGGHHHSAHRRHDQAGARANGETTGSWWCLLNFASSTGKACFTGHSSSLRSSR
ncbi:unnamed protein product, partial [Heterosigma akashiwo]